MHATRALQHLTFNKIFLHKHAPYAIYRHQVDGEHNNNVHDHDFVELVLISGGTGTQLTPHGSVPLRAGSLFVLQPGVWHGYVDCEAMLVNVCAIDRHLFDRELAWLRNNSLMHYLLWESAITAEHHHVPIHMLLPHQIVRCSKGFFTLQEIEVKETLQARVQQIGRLISFLGDVADCVAMNTPLSSQDGKPTVSSIVVEKTLLLFSENVARNWSITELSARFGLTTPYYIRLFKREMGIAPLAYLSGLRARRAAHLLTRSECSITNVGIEVGWEELGYFSRRFRHYFGVSPREYRQKYRDCSHT
jgi:AraC family transcriptional regulator, L-rhamnose operon transcriptional activator RhaR